MITIEKEIEKYISDVNSKLLCSKEKKKELIEDIRGAVFDFVDGSGTKDISDIYKHFGTPEELATAHMSELDPAQIKKKVNIRRVLIVAAVVALVIFTICLTVAVINSYKSVNGSILVDLIEGTSSIPAYIHSSLSI